MRIIRFAAIECNNKETDRQLKKQFIHALNDNDMLLEIITELTKMEEGSDVKSKQVLVWAKKAQSVIITSK